MLKLNKILILMSILIFLGCKTAYIQQRDPFSNQLETKASTDVSTLQKGQNPMRRPSYEEYQKSIQEW